MRAWKYQNLWHGCVGAWCPSLDVSRSLTLTDFSGYRNSGTLTNMDAASDWVASGSGYALDFDGSNDNVVTTAKLTTTAGSKTAYSFTAWIRPRTFPSFGIIFGASSAFELRHDTSGNAQLAIEAFSTTDTAALTTNRWSHVAGVCDGTTLYLYVNGYPRGTPAAVTHSNRTSVSFVIGARSGGSLPINGLLDDLRYYSRAITQSEVQMLAYRRGVAYEIARHRKARRAAVAGSGRNMMMGCGL